MAIDMGLTDAASVGGGVIMLASFNGGRRRHVMNYQDAIDICRVYGLPDLFVTFTCNTKWCDIIDVLSSDPGWQPGHCYALIMSALHMKVDEFIANIREDTPSDHVLAVAVEFQQRGLPHIHCLVWLVAFNSELSPGDVCAGGVAKTRAIKDI